MNNFTIKDLESLSGIKAHTIRIWEQRYNFLKPSRTSTNIRYYTNDELKTVLNIALLNKYGFKISQIDKMSQDEIKEKLRALTDPQAVQERIVNEMVQEMADLNMIKFETILSDQIRINGMEHTIIRTVFQFMERTGILWETGHIHPAQEHLVTNIIRQKLIVAIETNLTPVKNDRTFILFLPEGQQHELGILFIYYLLKLRGVNTIFLGANVPMKDVEHVVQLKKPDFAYVHLTGSCQGFNFEKFLSFVESNFKKTTTVISGQLTQLYRKKIPRRVEFKRSLGELTEYFSSL
jgi:MerR family transcriptional regulator, light-induced transcriptional regulator